MHSRFTNFQEFWKGARISIVTCYFSKLDHLELMKKNTLILDPQKERTQDLKLDMPDKLAVKLY
jgi:hypothetical protein